MWSDAQVCRRSCGRTTPAPAPSGRSRSSLGSPRRAGRRPLTARSRRAAPGRGRRSDAPAGRRARRSAARTMPGRAPTAARHRPRRRPPTPAARRGPASAARQARQLDPARRVGRDAPCLHREVEHLREHDERLPSPRRRQAARVEPLHPCRHVLMPDRGQRHPPPGRRDVLAQQGVVRRPRRHLELHLAAEPVLRVLPDRHPPLRRVGPLAAVELGLLLPHPRAQHPQRSDGSRTPNPAGAR